MRNLAKLMGVVTSFFALGLAVSGPAQATIIAKPDVILTTNAPLLPASLLVDHTTISVAALGNEITLTGYDQDGYDKGGCAMDGYDKCHNPKPPHDTPEPTTLAVLGAGLLALAATRRRRTD